MSVLLMKSSRLVLIIEIPTHRLIPVGVIENEEEVAAAKPTLLDHVLQLCYSRGNSQLLHPCQGQYMHKALLNN